MTNEWTHEHQNIFEDLKKGDASSLVVYMLGGGNIHPDLELHIHHRLNEGNFLWKSSSPKIGRPQGGWGEWRCINLYAEKKMMLTVNPKMRVTDIEHELAEKHASNVEDVKRHIRKGKKILQGLAEQPEMEWAKDMLAPILKVGGKQKR